MRTLFEHRYRLPRGKILIVGWLCFALGVAGGILLVVEGMDSRPRKLGFLYDFWPLGAVILQWIMAAGLAGFGALILWLLNSMSADREALIRITDQDITWQPHYLTGATVKLLLNQVTSVERRYAGRDLCLSIKSQQDEIILSGYSMGEAKLEEFATALEKALEQTQGGGPLEAMP